MNYPTSTHFRTAAMAITEHPDAATAVTASLPEPCILLHGQDMQT
jgi:hypothetical protein